MLGALRRHRVRDAEPRPARRALGALRPATHRLAAVHAGPPRPPRRRARLPVAAVGLDRGVGGRRSPSHLRRAGVTTMLVSATTRTCSRPAARTTTPTSPPGTTCAATRATRGGPCPTRRGSARRTLAGAALRRATTTTRATWFRDEEDFPGPQTMAAAATGSTSRRRRTDERVLPRSSTSSTRTSRSTRPSRGPSMYDPRLGRTARMIWPPYATAASATGVLDRARGARTSAPTTAPSCR